LTFSDRGARIRSYSSDHWMDSAREAKVVSTSPAPHRRGWTNISLGTAFLIVVALLLLMIVIGAVMASIGSDTSIKRYPVPTQKR
jgi:hypothetical protein